MEENKQPYPAKSRSYPLYKTDKISQIVPKKDNGAEDKIASVIMIFYRIFITILILAVAIAIAFAIYTNSDIILDNILIIVIVAIPVSIFLIKFIIEDIRM